jgi:hypothetical protein
LAKRNLELEMIINDVVYYHDLIFEISNKQESGILAFGLIPYVSLFITETYEYFKMFDPNYAKDLKREFEEIIRNSRQRIKLFDSRRKDFMDNLNLVDWVIDYQTSYFLNSHKGILSWLKRLLQPDQGNYFYKNHLISTTHTAMFNFGFYESNLRKIQSDAIKALSELSYSVAVEMGEFIGKFINDWDLDEEINCLTTNNIDADLFRFEDVKSEKYYRSVFNGSISPEINTILIFLLVTINYLGFILMNLVESTPDSLFKQKFIALYHIVASLEKLQNIYRPQGLLLEKSKYYISEIISDKQLKRIRSQSKLRNILVHYKIIDLSENKLSSNLRLYGLIENFLDGDHFDEINSKLDHQINRVSNLLEEWMILDN